MLSPDVLHRHAVQIRAASDGLVRQKKLAEARVLVVGAGGLGCPAIQNLAAMGIGCIGIADGDRVELSNLNRQTLFGPADLKSNKAERAAEWVRRFHPALEIVPFEAFFDEKTGPEMLADFDFALDCSDNLAARYCLDDVCFAQKKPWIYAGARRFDGQLSVFGFEGGLRWRDVFPDPKAFESELDCAAAGTVGFVPAALGALQAGQAYQIVCGQREAVLAGRLLVFNVEASRTRIFSLKKTSGETAFGLL